MNDRRPSHVVLIAANGKALAHIETNRTEFAQIATFDRGRTFHLIFTGDLAGLSGIDVPADIAIPGAVYQEVMPWRIGLRTIHRPTQSKRRRRRKSAVILPFPGPSGVGSGR